ncbi:ComEA family DNA-binding protein [Leucobacter weissii]|uniref:ComEA family DNA-binding protein n=2 Tax=Leucobacter weissii TaxID=1983706 RepID=A0A939MLC6_9MICO|nr:ComEA family DNA-binding protein [Leucobacter weissii]
MPALVGGGLFLLATVIAVVLVAVQSSGGIPGLEASEQPGRHELGSSEAEDPERTEGAEQPDGVALLPENAPGVFVHVVGEVRSPGVVELAPGSRVEEAIEAAGGARRAAELAGVNLAREVVDGEQIVVPDADAAAKGAPPGGAPDPAAADRAGGPIDLNTADAAALQTLPRVGPAIAQRIIDWREANGGFGSVEQLLEVSGIGEKTFESLRESVTV